MADTIQAKERKPKPRKKTRLCIKCGRPKPFDDFYINRDWKQQLGRDAWCRQCVNRCSTKEQIRQYFWANNRQYVQRIWQIAQAKAQKLVATNTMYQRSSEQRRQIILQKLTCQQIPTAMQPYYRYHDNTQDGKYLSYEQAKKDGVIQQTIAADEKLYSAQFNGWFTKRDMQWLQNYYEKLQQDFSFDNESTRDYARKVCKASLQSDKAQQSYAAGKCDLSTVKQAMNLFDMLSKSANFAACRRKAGQSSGLTSWSQTTLRLQTTGHTMQRKVQYPKDDIDLCIAQLSHIVQAVNLDNA